MTNVVQTKKGVNYIIGGLVITIGGLIYWFHPFYEESAIMFISPDQANTLVVILCFLAGPILLIWGLLEFVGSFFQPDNKAEEKQKK